MRDHTKLRAFELADKLVVAVYTITKSYPKEEMYGLVNQIRRAAVSVPSNIVEGCSRESQIEYLRFLEISFGSLRELHYQISLSNKLQYIQTNAFEIIEKQLIETEKVLSALIRSLRKTQPAKS